MTLMTRLACAAAALAFGTAAALAEPAIIYDLGGKHDKSFNEMAWTGAQRWAKETGKPYKEIELTNEAQREQALRQFAEAGYNPIAMTGFAFADTLNAVAQDYPNTKFAIVDSVVNQPNVESIVFTEQQSSYLAGIMAGMATKTNVVGFVGGMDVPLIRRFGCGYAQGVLAANPKAKVILNMTGTDGSAWNNPVKGAEIAKSQQAQGADVIYAAAGATGLGVLQAAADMKILSIGVDSNQDYLHPGEVLTSAIKRVDNAIYSVFKEGADMKPGVKVMDLAAGGVDVTFDKYNAPLVTPAMKAAVEKAKAGIIDGSIKVHDYTSDSSCPVAKF